MKRHFFVLCGFILTVNGVLADQADTPAVAEEAAEAAETAFTGVGIAVVGELDEAAVERVRAFAERNTSIPVRVRDITLASGANLGKVADQLAPERVPEDAAFILLYAGESGFTDHTVYRYHARTGIVNVTLLQTDDEEQFLRRVEKLTMRSLGLLMNVPPVPNPQSAMWTYSNLEELDLMGRNFDPPSLRVIQRNAVDMGIELIADSPLRMIRP